jgi:hypothetical protein
MSWEILTYDSKYEMCTVYPHVIRPIGSDINIEEKYIDELKAFVVDIEGDIKSKAFLIAVQFLHLNPDDYDSTITFQLKFKNKNKSDCRIANLDWGAYK